MPLGVAGARRVPRLVAPPAPRAPRRLPRSHELSGRLQVGAGGGGGSPRPGGAGDCPGWRLRATRTARPTGSCGCWPARVDRYFAVSREIAAELVEELDWPAEKVEVLYNAVDVERTAVAPPPGLREQLGGSGTRPLVLTPARLNAQKGHDTLLGAVAEVPEALFLLAGDGPERERLEALASELGVGDRVRFLGRREDIPQLLAACDVFALPSLYEGSSLAVLEAMAAGIPIVSSAIGGTDELIDDGRSGMLVPPGDAAALAVALRRVLGGPAAARGLRGAGARAG